MLKDEGMNVSVDEAGEILKFLTNMATVKSIAIVSNIDFRSAFIFIE